MQDDVYLTDWAVDSRYPDPENDATDEDASEAIRQARAVFIAVRRDLRAHGFDIALEEAAEVSGLSADELR